MRRAITLLIVLCLLTIGAGVAEAIPVSHEIIFITTSSSVGVPPIGTIFFGFFSVDDSLLSMTGVNLPGTVSAFRIAMLNSVWDISQPSDFSGFRGPIPGEPCTACLFAPSPGFDVLNGEIVGLRGGVFGPADFPFADFRTDAFNAFPRGAPQPFRGDMAIRRVLTPAPAPALLMLLGFIVVAITAGKAL